MHVPTRIGRSLHGIGDRRDLVMFRGLVGAIYLHELDRLARSDLHDIARLGVAERLGKLADEGRERHHADLAAVGGRGIGTAALGEITAAAQRRQQAVGQLLLGIGEYDMAQTERVGSLLDRQHAGHRPLVVLQHGTIGLAIQQGGSLILAQAALGNQPQDALGFLYVVQVAAVQVFRLHAAPRKQRIL